MSLRKYTTQISSLKHIKNEKKNAVLYRIFFIILLYIFKNLIEVKIILHVGLRTLNTRIHQNLKVLDDLYLES